MFVCRTLDYIVNEDLHRYLDEKLTHIKSIGVEVEIELTEPIDDIIIDAKELIKMIEQIIDDALVLMKETDNKKMLFCSFYHEYALWVIIKYNATVTTPLRCLNKKLNKILNKYININSNITYEESSLTQELIIYKERG
jgi:hypothetical protein